MFLTHQSQIQAYAKQSPDNCFKVLRFVQMSIQQHFSGLPAMTEEIVKTGDCKRLSQRQRDAIKVYHDRRHEIHEKIFSSMSVADKLLFVASLPGFGLVKAGFVLQCCIGEAGCFDVHNCREFNVKPSDFSLGKTYSKNLEKAEKYLNTCEKTGGCAFLWDNWCQGIYEKYPKKYANADHVSRLHVSCVLYDGRVK